MFDLFEEDPDLFVAGLAAGNQRVGVFSFFRYNPTLTFSTEFWYDIEHSQEMAPAEKKCTTLQRSCKLLVHEVCHLLGLDHCIWFSCLMNGSGHLHEDFSQPMTLCPVDLHKLQTLCGFDRGLQIRWTANILSSMWSSAGGRVGGQEAHIYSRIAACYSHCMQVRLFIQASHFLIIISSTRARAPFAITRAKQLLMRISTGFRREFQTRRLSGLVS